MGAACLLHNRHRRNLYDLHNKDINHLVNELQLRILYGLQNRRNHGDLPLRHDRDLTTLSTNCSCTHLSLYSNGHVDNLQELHLEHCGDMSLRHNWNVHHLDDELDLRHLQVLVRHGLLELKHDHRDVHKPPSSPNLSPPPPTPSGNPLWGSRAPPQTDVMLTAVSLYRAQGSAGAWVSSPEGGRHATATSSGQQLPKECRPSSDPARCPCRPLGPPATVTPGRLLASPVSPLKGQTDWVLSPSTTTRWPAPGGGWWWWWWCVAVCCGVVVVVLTRCNDDVCVDTVARACTELGCQVTWE